MATIYAASEVTIYTPKSQEAARAARSPSVLYLVRAGFFAAVRVRIPCHALAGRLEQYREYFIQRN